MFKYFCKIWHHVALHFNFHDLALACWSSLLQKIIQPIHKHRGDLNQPYINGLKNNKVHISIYSHTKNGLATGAGC